MVRGQREKIFNGQMGVRGLKTRVRRECSNSRGVRLCSGGLHVKRIRGGSHSVTAGGSSKSESCQEL